MRLDGIVHTSISSHNCHFQNHSAFLTHDNRMTVMKTIDKRLGSMKKWNDEVERGERFEFGKNWSHFLTVLNEDRIVEAQKELQDFLGAQDLTGKRFLDIGSGSGLHSLCAQRMGFRVRSFDYDQDSVRCTEELKRRYAPDASHFEIPARAMPSTKKTSRHIVDARLA